MSKRLRLLHIEDSENDAALLRRHLVRAGYDLVVHRVETPTEMEAALADEPWDVVIADFLLPRFSAPAALELMKAKGLDLPFLIVSGAIGEEAAVTAMRAGAHDYVMKDNLTRLTPAIERELQEAQNRRDRRRAEAERAEAVRQNEQLLALLDTLMNTAPVGMGFLDTEFRFVRVNPALAAMTGYSAEDHLGRYTYDLVPETWRRLEHILRGVLETGQPEVNLESRGLTPASAGKDRHFLSNIYPVSTPAGERLGIGFVASDITAIKQTEEALRDSEARLAGQKRVLEMIAGGAPLHKVLDESAMYLDQQSEESACVILILDQSGSFLEVAAAPGLPAHVRQAIVGHRVPFAMIPPHVHERRLVVQSLETNPAVWDEYRALCLHFGLRAGWATPIIGTNGETLGLVGAVHPREYCPTPRDWNLMETVAHLSAIAIERHVADEARQIKLEALVRHMAEGVVAVGPDRRILLANAAALRMLGLPAPVAGCRLEESGLPTVLVDSLRTALGKGPGDRAVRTFSWGDLHLEAVVSPVRSERGRQYGAIALLKDVTADLQFRRLQESLVANVSHELRGPIAALSASLEAMRDGVVPPESHGRYLSASLAELQRLGRLTFDLLELSRLDAGAVQITRRPFELAPLFERMQALWSQPCAAAGLSLQVACPPLGLLGDSDRVEQITANLLDNAVRFTPKGGSIRVEAVELERKVKISVTDTGVGIPREHLPYVWERFYKVDPARTRSARHGTGLGLSIVRHLVERMGGTVAVDSEPGRGSCFSFTLPRAY